MNISIIIADRNREYLDRISEVLQQYDDLTISICTDGEQFQTMLDSGRYNIALFDPDISEQRLLFQRVKLAVCLYSDEARNSGMYADIVNVKKYQRISNIYKGIVREYADKAGYSAEFDKSQNTRIAAVYSPVGGSGKTTVALAVASGLANTGRSVLLVGLEQLNSACCVNPKHENGLIKLIESALNKEVDFSAKVKGIAKEGVNGSAYVEGFDRIVDYGDVSDEEIEAVLSRIKRTGIYDVIVLDLESHISGVERTALELADHIVVVEKPGELPAMKMRLFAEQALTAEYRGKMSCVGNFAESNTKYANALDVQTIGYVHNYGNLPLKSMLQAIITNGEIDVEKILKR